MPENTTSILDDPDVIAALGPGEELTDEQAQLLEILLDPANDPSEAATSRTDVIWEFEIFTGTDIDELEQVADRILTYLSRMNDRYDIFAFELVRGRDGVVEQYNVLTRFGTTTWLTSSEDAKYLFGARHDLTGLRAALYTAETIMGDHTRLLADAKALAPADARPTLVRIRQLCQSTEYKIPGKHETWDNRHEARQGFADEIEQILDEDPDAQVVSTDRVSEAFNHAADMVLAHGEHDERINDTVNLVVNAGLHLLDHPEDTLPQVIEANYDETVDEVLDYLR